MASRTPAVKRLMKELLDLQSDPCSEFVAAPLESDVYEWHFTIRGPNEGGFQGGRYHVDYPFKPPNIYFLTANGRFELGKKICLSITSFHQETWRPAWGLRTALIALISFMTTKGEGAIGAIDCDDETRKILAVKSRDWVCQSCGSKNATCLDDESDVPIAHLEGDPELVLGGESKSDSLSKNTSDACMVHGETVSGQNVYEEVRGGDEATSGLIERQTEVERTPLPEFQAEAIGYSMASPRIRKRAQTIAPVVDQIDPRALIHRERPHLLYFVVALIVIIVCRRIFLLVSS